LANFAIWDIDLTDDEVAALGTGRIHPFLIRPQNLRKFWPLFGNLSPEPSIVESFDMTLTGTAKGDHKELYHPDSPIIQTKGFVPPPGDAIGIQQLHIQQTMQKHRF